MRSSRRRVALTWGRAVLAASACSWSANAQPRAQAQGFDLERLYTSAPGGGWFVMDTLDIEGGLGGAISAVTSYAKNPLRITQGLRELDVVSDEAFLELGLAVTYSRFRLYVSFDSPLWVQGNSGTIAGYTFAAPSVNPGSDPDAVSHGRIGVDMRALGRRGDPFRLGFGLQLWLPGGAPGSLQSNYLSDGPPSQSFGAYNAMARVLFAGDVGRFTYAGQVGFNLRPLSESPQPESPRGSELLFGVAGGARIPLCHCRRALVAGAEIFGETAVLQFFGAQATGVEGLLTARWEGTADGEPQLPPQARLRRRA